MKSRTHLIQRLFSPKSFFKNIKFTGQEENPLVSAVVIESKDAFPGEDFCDPSGTRNRPNWRSL